MNSAQDKKYQLGQDQIYNQKTKIQKDYDRSLDLKTAECADLHRLVAIDFSLYDSQKPLLTKQLIEQMEGAGFCILKNVPGFDEDDLKMAIQEFYNGVSIEQKDCLKLKHFNQENQNIYRGYFPFIDNDPSHKEMFDIGRPLSDIDEKEKLSCVLYEENPWLKDDIDNRHYWIYQKFMKYFFILHETGLKILNMLALALNKRENFFDAWFKKECSSSFRAIHYLPRSSIYAAKADQLDANLQKLVTPEHSDSGFVTLLSTFMYQGLQVEINGDYKSIMPEHNTLIMNIGDALSKISNYRFKATRHRVLDIGSERYSCPFFLCPKFSAMICDNIIESGRQLCEDPEYEEREKQNGIQTDLLPYGKLLCNKLVNSYGEWKGFQIPQEMQFN